MIASFSLVLFDLDGTLLNTLEDLAEAVNFALKQRNLPLLDLDGVRTRVGHGVRNMIQKSLPEPYCADEACVDACLAAFRKYYTEHIDVHTVPYPGIPELLADLDQAGVKLAVVSNKFQEGTEYLIRRFFPGIRFSSILGNRPGCPLKPDPAIVQEALAQAGVPADKAVLVGDSATDMATADNGGILAIGVSWGYRPASSIGTTWIVDTISELRSALLEEGYDGGETRSNVERRKALEKYLKETRCPEDTLGRMLEDPKTGSLLRDGMGGMLEHKEMTFTVRPISPATLIPARTSIDVSETVDVALTDPGIVRSVFENRDQLLVDGMPLVTFRHNFLIDGHRRWTQVFTVCPEARLLCCDYDAGLTIIQLRREIGMGLFAGENGNGPHAGLNLFDDNWEEAAIRQHVLETVTDDVVDVFRQYVDSVDDKESLADYVTGNIMRQKFNNYPFC